MSGRNLRIPVEARFWPKVRRGADDECWMWTAYIEPCGYGRFWVPSLRGMIQAQRVAWMLTHGDIPDGLCVLHKCDVRACVNPAHLFLGTRADNMRDMWSKGRQGKPDHRGKGRARLNPIAVRVIRHLAGKGVSLSGLARAHGVTPTAICDLVHRRSWSHVP